jgi:hypothetical protein
VKEEKESALSDGHKILRKRRRIGGANFDGLSRLWRQIRRMKKQIWDEMR